MQRFNSLLLAFQTLPKEKQNRTVMQVSGYPHYENVCSNILAFYLDPAEEHNMGGLVLESLLEVAQSKSESPKDNENTHSLENVSIYREYGTSKRQRIDLVVTGEEFVIGIENKIYHWVANDLDHYSDTIEGIAKAENASPELHPYKIVLGLTHPPHTQLSGGFVSITYEELWQQVQLQLGAVLTNASPKWVTYLLDFIQTTEHLKGNHMEFKENDQFFIDHHAELHKLFTERHQFFNRLGHQAYRLFTLMNEDKEALAPLAKDLWIHQKRCLVFDFQFTDDNGKPIHLAYDLWLEATGWELQLFGRNEHCRSKLPNFVQQSCIQDHSLPISASGGRVVLQKWETQAQLEDIATAMGLWVRRLCEAAKAR